LQLHFGAFTGATGASTGGTTGGVTGGEPGLTIALHPLAVIILVRVAVFLHTLQQS